MMNWENLSNLLVPEGNVVKVECDGVVLWEKEQGLPTEYQQVEWLQAAADVGAYIDLGFVFDTAAKIYINQDIYNGTATYPFGATENSGKVRCCLSSPYGGGCVLYGANATTYIQSGATYLVGSSSTYRTNELVLTLEAGNLNITNLTTENSGNSLPGQVAYTMTNRLYLFAQNYNGTARFGGIRQISKFQYYDKNDELICDLIPCYRKSDGEPGMYDIVRRTFLTNIGTGSFTTGPEISGGGTE